MALTPRYAELDVTTNFSFLRGGSHAEELVATAKALGLAAIDITDRNTLAELDVTTNFSFLRGGSHAEELVATAKALGLCGNRRHRPQHACRRGARASCRARRSAASNSSSAPPRSRRCAEPACLPNGPRRLRQALPAAHAWPAPRREREMHAPSRRRRRPRRRPHLHRAAPDDFPPLETISNRSSAASSRRWGRKTRLYLAASHSYRGDDRARIEALAQLAARVGLPLVATNAVLYHAAHRRPLQDVLTCIREKCTIHDAGLKLEANAERHLKPPQEMARLFAGHEDALARTIEIADACTFSLDELKYEYPDEPVPRRQDAAIASRRSHLGGRRLALPRRHPREGARHAREGARADRGARLRALFPHRARHRALRPARSTFSARGAARRRTPPSATASPSPMSTRPRSTFCSSASSRRSGRSRPTSTSISSMSGARR